MRYSIYLPYLIVKEPCMRNKSTIILIRESSNLYEYILTSGYILYSGCLCCTCCNYWMNIRTNSLCSFTNTYLRLHKCLYNSAAKSMFYWRKNLITSFFGCEYFLYILISMLFRLPITVQNVCFKFQYIEKYHMMLKLNKYYTKCNYILEKSVEWAEMKS